MGKNRKFVLANEMNRFSESQDLTHEKRLPKGVYRAGKNHQK